MQDSPTAVDWDYMHKKSQAIIAVPPRCDNIPNLPCARQVCSPKGREGVRARIQAVNTTAVKTLNGLNAYDRNGF